MITTEAGTVRTKGDAAEIISDFTVIVNIIKQFLLEGLDEEDTVNLIIKQVAAGLMSDEEFDKYIETDDASKKVAEIFEIYSKKNDKAFN